MSQSSTVLFCFALNIWGFSRITTSMGTIQIWSRDWLTVLRTYALELFPIGCLIIVTRAWVARELSSGIVCIWQAFTNTRYHLFIARFILGFGIGIRSATVPAYATECAPKHIRGALVMLWPFSVLLLLCLVK